MGKNKPPMPLKRPTVDQLRLAGHRCRARARRDGEADPLTWMELGVMLDTTDGFRAVDVIWHAFTVGYPSGGTGGGGSNAEPSSSTERAALARIGDPKPATTSRKKLRERTDPAAISLKIIALLVDGLAGNDDAPYAKHVDANQARTLVIGLRSAFHHPSRTGTACPDCGHIVDTHIKKCWRKDCSSNAVDRECGRCGEQIGDDEKMVSGMHRKCYDQKTYEEKRTTTETNRGTKTVTAEDLALAPARVVPTEGAA